MDQERLKTLSDDLLLREYEQRVALEKTLVGQLYRSIVYDEIEALGQECIRRHTYHPNWWREKGIVPSTWTDEFGVTHAWVSSHTLLHRKADEPTKEVTCLQCIATTSL